MSYIVAILLLLIQPVLAADETPFWFNTEITPPDAPAIERVLSEQSMNDEQKSRALAMLVLEKQIETFPAEMRDELRSLADRGLNEIEFCRNCYKAEYSAFRYPEHMVQPVGITIFLPKEMKGTSVGHFLFVHEFQHLLQYRALKLAGEYAPSHQDLPAIERQRYVSKFEATAIAVEFSFLKILPEAMRKTAVKAIKKSRSQMSGNGRYMQRAFTATGGTVTDYLNFNWKMGRYNPPEIIVKKSSTCPDLLKPYYWLVELF